MLSHIVLGTQFRSKPRILTTLELWLGTILLLWVLNALLLRLLLLLLPIVALILPLLVHLLIPRRKLINRLVEFGGVVFEGLRGWRSKRIQLPGLRLLLFLIILRQLVATMLHRILRLARWWTNGISSLSRIDWCSLLILFVEFHERRWRVCLEQIRNVLALGDLLDVGVAVLELQASSL